jgi:hypothetical protein
MKTLFTILVTASLVVLAVGVPAADSLGYAADLLEAVGEGAVDASIAGAVAAEVEETTRNFNIVLVGVGIVLLLALVGGFICTTPEKSEADETGLPVI